MSPQAPNRFSGWHVQIPATAIDFATDTQLAELMRAADTLILSVVTDTYEVSGGGIIPDAVRDLADMGGAVHSSGT